MIVPIIQNMKVVILLIFVLLLGYQVYLNLQVSEVEAPTSIETTKRAIPQETPPPDIPPAIESIPVEAPPVEEVVPTDDQGTPLPTDVASGVEDGKSAPTPEGDVGSQLKVDPTDKGSMLAPSKTGSSEDKGS